MGTAQVAFVVVLCVGATGSHVTGNHVTGSDVSHVTGSGPEPEVTSVIRKYDLRCATGSCAISAVVGPRK